MDPTGVGNPLTPEQWYSFVCGNDGEVLKWFVHIATYVFTPVVVASIAANFKVITRIPIIGPLVNAVALNWTTYVERAAQAQEQKLQGSSPPAPVAPPKGKTP